MARVVLSFVVQCNGNFQRPKACLECVDFHSHFRERTEGVPFYKQRPLARVVRRAMQRQLPTAETLPFPLTLSLTD
jgi:hypothetical protein